MEQVQCTNCGGFKVIDKKAIFDPVKKSYITPIVFANSNPIPWRFQPGAAGVELSIQICLIALLAPMLTYIPISELIKLLITNSTESCTGLVIKLSCINQYMLLSLLSVGFILLLVLFLIPFFIKLRKDSRSFQRSLKRGVTVHFYQCILCGYEWQWIEGEPLPQVTVRPDLIAKGEERLRD